MNCGVGRRDRMNRCATCKYAIFDYTEYYGTTVKNWFVEDCRKSEDFTADECDEYEEYRDETN